MSYELPVERGKIREFARAVQSRHPGHQGPDAVAPPTFLTTARLVWEPREQNPLGTVDIDLRRTLHAEEEYIFHGPPPRAGQTLNVSSRIDRQWEKEGRRGGTLKFVLVVSEFRDEHGGLLAEQRSTLVQTSKPAKEG